MTEATPLDATGKKERIKNALFAVGHVFVADVLPALTKVALPFLLSYLAKKGVDINTEKPYEPSP